MEKVILVVKEGVADGVAVVVPTSAEFVAESTNLVQISCRES